LIVPSFSEAVVAINDLKEAKLIEDYAIGGAMAAVFWTEAITTFDLDVLVLLPSGESSLISLAPIYAWAEERQYPLRDEHIVIGGVPVQFLPAYSALAEEAVREAKTLDYNGLPVRVVRPEHLIGLALEGSAKTARRRERAAMLRETAEVDETVLQSIIERYTLSW
jgi:hypothetical protein